MAVLLWNTIKSVVSASELCDFRSVKCALSTCAAMFHLVSSLPWQPTSVPLYPCLFFLLCFVLSFLYVVLFVALPPQGIQQGALCRACVCDTVRSGALSELLVCYGMSWCLFYGYVCIDFSIFFASFVFCGATASASYLYLCIFCCGRTCPLVGIFCIVCVCVCVVTVIF